MDLIQKRILPRWFSKRNVRILQTITIIMANVISEVEGAINTIIITNISRNGTVSALNTTTFPLRPHRRLQLIQLVIPAALSRRNTITSRQRPMQPVMAIPGDDGFSAITWNAMLRLLSRCRCCCYLQPNFHYDFANRVVHRNTFIFVVNKSLIKWQYYFLLFYFLVSFYIDNLFILS